MPAMQPTPVMNVSAALLETVAARSEHVETAYDARDSIPAITLAEYLARWAQYAQTGDMETLHAVIFIDRVCTRTGMALTRRNVHRVVFCALLIATKYREEHPYKASHYAKVGGVSLAELHDLEAQFITDLDWACFVDEATMEQYESKFRCHPMWDADAEDAEEEDVLLREDVRAPAVLRG